MSPSTTSTVQENGRGNPESEGGSDSTGDDLTANAAFEILGNARRRRILYYLAETEGEAPLSELAANIAADEQDVPRSEVTNSQRRLVFIPLYQMHIPRLEEAGIVQYDSETGTVRLTNEDALIEQISWKARRSEPWYYYYIGWTVIGVIAVLAAWFGVLPTTRVLWTILALVLVSGMILIAGLQYWLHGRG